MQIDVEILHMKKSALTIETSLYFHSMQNMSKKQINLKVEGSVPDLLERRGCWPSDIQYVWA